MVLCKINQARLMKVSLVFALFDWDDRVLCEPDMFAGVSLVLAMFRHWNKELYMPGVFAGIPSLGLIHVL